jgi:hypothetical protein
VFERKENDMDLFNLIVLLIIVGVGLYLINTYVPMAAPIKTLINVVIVLAVFLWVVRAFLPTGGYIIGPHVR